MSGEQLEPGTLLNGRYRILRVIGKGGMGTVYQAEHIRLDTILAIKEVRAPQTADTDAQALLAQCEHEARFLVRLHHPNLPQVTDAFVEDDRFFLVMEYIEGVTLEAKERIARPDGLPVGTVIDWALQIADVLAYLHSQDPPVIFRDMKPANVMVEANGRIRLIDFGIARHFQPGAVKDTNLLGSVGYSPPEQFGRHQTDTRSDIYAFGATLHSLLTGRDPSHTPFKFASVRSINPAVPEPLSRLIDCCLRLDADARPQTIHEVAMELLAIRDTVPSESLTQTAPTRDTTEQTGSPPSGGAKIILTNPTLRNAGKTQRSTARAGSAGLASDRLNPAVSSGPSSARTSAGELAAPLEVTTPVSATLPAGRTSGAGPNYWIVGAAAVAAVIGAAAWLLKANAMHPDGHANALPHAVTAPTTALPPTNSRTGPLRQTAPTASQGTTPADTGSAPVTSLNHAVVFDSVQVKGAAVDAQGHRNIEIDVAGTAEGSPGDQEVIAAFFYDGQNAQVPSQLPQTPYSSKDGKLSVATSLTLTSAKQPFSLSLQLPLAAFPEGTVGGVQFHCVAFYGDQRIGETREFVPIGGALLAPGPPVQDGAGPGPATANGQTMPSTTRGPGTFGSSPVRGE